MEYSDFNVLAEDNVSEKSCHLLSERLREKRQDTSDSLSSNVSDASVSSLAKKTAIRPPPIPGMERLMARHPKANAQPQDASDPVAAMASKMDEDRKQMEEAFNHTLSEAKESLIQMHRLADLRGENYRTNWVVEALKDDGKPEGADGNKYDRAYIHTNTKRLEEFEAAEKDVEVLPDRPKNTFKESKVKVLREKLGQMNRKAQSCLEHIESAKRALDDMSALSSRVDVDDDDPGILKMKVLLNDEYLRPEVLELLKSPREEPVEEAEEDDYLSDEDLPLAQAGTDTPAFLTDSPGTSLNMLLTPSQVPPVKTKIPK